MSVPRRILSVDLLAYASTHEKINARSLPRTSSPEMLERTIESCRSVVEEFLVFY